MKTRQTYSNSLCVACGGSGILSPAKPSCSIARPRGTWIVVERCDSCEKYPDDLTAALARFKIAAWFLCANGGEHALAQTPSRPPKCGTVTEGAVGPHQ